MVVLPLLAVAGVVFAGTRMLKKTRVVDPEINPSDAMRKLDQTTAASLISLGVASAGSLAKIPVLGIATLPVTLYVFSPVLKHTWQKLRKDHRVDDQALISSRMAVYIVFNYPFIAALDAALYASSQRFFLQKEERFEHKLKEHGLPAPVIKQMINQPCATQSMGEHTSDRAIPLMMATFVLTLPVLGPNLAAAFLTTNFGGHLRKLGPNTSTNYIADAIEKNIVVVHADALEQMARADIILIDEQVLEEVLDHSDKQQWVHHLRKQYGGKLYLSGPQDQSKNHDLVNTFDLDGHIESSEQTQALQNLQHDGHPVCKVALGDSYTASSPVVLSIAEAPGEQNNTGYVHIQLAAESLHQLATVFDISKAFATKQQFNLKAPMAVDLVDISTTLLFDFGLVYSVLFTYSGLAIGAVNTGAGITTPRNDVVPDLSEARVTPAVHAR